MPAISLNINTTSNVQQKYQHTKMLRKLWRSNKGWGGVVWQKKSKIAIFDGCVDCRWRRSPMPDMPYLQLDLSLRRCSSTNVVRSPLCIGVETI